MADFMPPITPQDPPGECPLRVLTVTNVYPSPERPDWGPFIRSQVLSLEAKGVQTDVLVIDGYKSKLNYLRAIWQLHRMCRRGVYDLVHAHYGLCGLVARTQRACPVVVSFLGNDLYGSPNAAGKPTRSSVLLAQLHIRLARSVDGVIVKSQAMARFLPDIHVAVIPNGVDFERFRPLCANQCRRELGLDPNATYLLFPASRKRVRKNFPLARAAVDLLNGGNGRSGGRIEIITTEGVPHEQMPLYLNAVDALILVSLWEGSPNVVKEALACGTRVVSTSVGDVPELLEGVEGCAVCLPTASDVARGIAEVLRHPRPIKAREHIGHLRLGSIADRVITEYARVLTLRRRRVSRALRQCGSA